MHVICNGPSAINSFFGWYGLHTLCNYGARRHNHKFVLKTCITLYLFTDKLVIQQIARAVGGGTVIDWAVWGGNVTNGLNNKQNSRSKFIFFSCTLLM